MAPKYDLEDLSTVLETSPDIWKLILLVVGASLVLAVVLILGISFALPEDETVPNPIKKRKSWRR